MTSNEEKIETLNSSINAIKKELKQQISLKILLDNFRFLIEIKNIRFSMLTTRQEIKELNKKGALGDNFDFFEEVDGNLLSDRDITLRDTWDWFYNFMAKTVKTIFFNYIKLELYKLDKDLRVKNNKDYKNIQRQEEKIREIVELVEKVTIDTSKLMDLAHEINVYNLEELRFLKIKTYNLAKSLGFDKLQGLGFVFSSENKFKSIYEHIKYLRDKDLYKVTDEKNSAMVISVKRMEFEFMIRFYEQKQIPDILYHSTSLKAAKDIFENGMIKGRLGDLDYNKIFFTPDLRYSMFHGQMGGISNYWGDTYIIFEVDLKDYELYAWVDDLEFVVWGEVKTDVIKKIYLADKFNVVKEITLEELSDF